MDSGSTQIKNLFTNESFNKFNKARECLQIYCLAPFMSSKRNVAYEVLDSLESFIGQNFEKGDVELINETLNLLVSTNKKKEVIKDSDEVSEAISIAEKYLSNPPISIEEFRFTCHVVISCIHGDFFAADKAYCALKAGYILKGQLREDFVGLFLSNLAGASGVLLKTCEALARFNMKHELEEASKITSELLDTYIEVHNKNQDDDFFKLERFNYPSKYDLMAELGKKVVVVHLEQARNAFRLGFLSEKKFKEKVEKFSKGEDEQGKIKAEIIKYYLEHKAIINLDDTIYNIEETCPNHTLSLEYQQERFTDLDDDQKAEYVTSFLQPNVTQECIKYLGIRCNEILLGLIYKFDNVDLSSLSNEIDFLKSKNTRFKPKFSLLRELLDYLCALGAVQRSLKLKLLQGIDIRDKPVRGISVQILIGFDEENDRYKFKTNHSVEHKKRACVDEDYIELAKAEYESILEYKKTGEICSSFTIEMEKDRERIERFDRSPVSKRRDKISFSRSPFPPEEVIDSLENYLEAVMEMSKELNPKSLGDIQIGYTVNHLTTEYAKIKKWDKVIQWAETFFSVHENFRERSSKGEQEKINKRLERARKELFKKNV